MLPNCLLEILLHDCDEDRNIIILIEAVLVELEEWIVRLSILLQGEI
jgi:hypothetical protein